MLKYIIAVRGELALHHCHCKRRDNVSAECALIALLIRETQFSNDAVGMGLMAQKIAFRGV